MDPIFEEEQQHLTNTYEKLLHIEQDVRAQLDADLAEALEDKEDMFDEMTRDFAADIQLETLAELEAMNRIIESYNLSADINTEKLRRAQLLLKKPYFAKVRLQFPKGEEPKDIYIGAAGMTDEVRRHFIVDWRSPVAEVYYNQSAAGIAVEAPNGTSRGDYDDHPKGAEPCYQACRCTGAARAGHSRLWQDVCVVAAHCVSVLYRA